MVCIEVIKPVVIPPWCQSSPWHLHSQKPEAYCYWTSRC